MRKKLVVNFGVRAFETELRNRIDSLKLGRQNN